MVKNPSAYAGDVRDTGLILVFGRSLDWEDTLEEGMATDSSFLAWRIPWTEEARGIQSIGSQSRTRLKRLSTHTLHI